VRSINLINIRTVRNVRSKAKKPMPDELGFIRHRLFHCAKRFGKSDADSAAAL
jgi:hypothetical protein